MQCAFWAYHMCVVCISNRHPFKRSENRCLHLCSRRPVDRESPRYVVDEHIFQVSASFHWRYYGSVRSRTLFNFLQMFLLTVVRRDDVNLNNRENCVFNVYRYDKLNKMKIVLSLSFRLLNWYTIIICLPLHYYRKSILDTYSLSK